MPQLQTTGTSLLSVSELRTLTRADLLRLAIYALDSAIELDLAGIHIDIDDLATLSPQVEQVDNLPAPARFYYAINLLQQWRREG